MKAKHQFSHVSTLIMRVLGKEQDWEAMVELEAIARREAAHPIDCAIRTGAECNCGKQEAEAFVSISNGALDMASRRSSTG